jgi:hypothetical protein
MRHYLKGNVMDNFILGFAVANLVWGVIGIKAVLTHGRSDKK